MQFVISSSTLSKHLSAISGVILSNPIIPILENFLFEIDSNKLTITASDLQTSVTSIIDINVVGEISIAVPAKILLDMLKSLPDQPIKISMDDQSYSMEIASNNGKYKLAGENAADFPRLIMGNDGVSLKIDSEILKNAIGYTIISASKDELKPALNGIFVNFTSNSSTFVSTDGFKLSKYVRTDIGIATQNPFIVPKKTFSIVNTILGMDKKMVDIVFNSHFICFQMNKMCVISRLIDERYPNYQNIIPQGNTNKLVVNRLDMLKSIKRIAIFANKTTRYVGLIFSEGLPLQIFAEDLNFSNEATESIQCEYTGMDMKIGFKVDAIDIIASLNSEEIEMHFSEPHKACLILPVEKEVNEDILFLTMPISLENMSG